MKLFTAFPSTLQVQWAGSDEKVRSPTATADKGFLCSKGKIALECTLDKEVYYHGQEIPVHVSINNNSKKSVKSVRVSKLRYFLFELQNN